MKGTLLGCGFLKEKGSTAFSAATTSSIFSKSGGANSGHSNIFGAGALTGSNVAVVDHLSGPSSSPKGKKIEDIYQKKTQLEHILLRPDTYIGSVERDTVKLWVMNEETNKMEIRSLSFVPGLYKIFDEILVNAADNKIRDTTMDLIKVDINKEANTISVWNSGKGLPVELHKLHNMYVPELVFGVLLTSSNYDDEEKKITGGRNGYGAKLTNIFSLQFTVETSVNGMIFKKTWRKNMTESDPAVVKPFSGKPFTCVTFKPDLTKFGMTALEDDIVLMMKKRVWDLAGCSEKSLKVKLNGNQLPVAGFKNYCELYPISEAIGNSQFEIVNDRWTVCVAGSDFGFQHVSFVNGIWTFKGGKHVDYIVQQIVDRLSEKLKKRKHEVKGITIKNHLWVFVTCKVENPAFDSQTKETLTTTKAKFGSTCQLSDKFLESLAKSDIINKIIAEANTKVEQQLNKAAAGGSRSKKLLNIPKLEEANFVATSRSKDCTMVLTEGDSAKTLAISGFSVVGRDFWGVFPLRGKVLNVREASPQIILKNQEIQHIMQILGLKVGVKYEDTSKLRYGHLMIMADQDHDGSHIKGLIMNFIHYFWPSLLESCPGFVVQFITPIVKATRTQPSVVHSFFSMPQFTKWFEETPDVKRYKIKYYKGLGTSGPDEAKQYFKNLASHRIIFDYEGEEDKERLLLAFDKHRADDRKLWLASYKDGDCVDYNQKHLRVRDFVNKELILFSRADCERSLPSVVDGFKPSMRKILFCCFKKKGMFTSEIKVVQLAGYVSEHSAYHHGEVSLQSTIIGMAQDFVGSNNVNLLLPHGQFGTRIAGGKDASQPRYIFTQLSPLARAIFPQSDDNLLKYNVDDGKSVEPEWYIPILPLVLVNGAKGIGTGFSTSIPMHNPEEIVEYLKCLINGTTNYPDLHPWYKDFTGRIVRGSTLIGGAAASQADDVFGNAGVAGGDPTRSYQCYGKICKVSDTVINITELPIECWTENYKKFIEDLMAKELIYDFREHHTDVTVDFEVQMDPETLAEWESVGLEKKFNLRSSIPVSNLVCFDHNGRIFKYNSVADIMLEFFNLRKEFYRKRKNYLVDSIGNDCSKLQNMVRFVLEVIAGEIKVMKQKKKDLLTVLKTKGYRAFPHTATAHQQEMAAPTEEDQEEANAEDAESNVEEKNSDYDYLLGMKIWALTHERVEQLKRQLKLREQELNDLLALSIEDLWIRDLDHFLEVYRKQEALRLGKRNSHNPTASPTKANSHSVVSGAGSKASKQKSPHLKSSTTSGTSLRLSASSFIPKRSEKAKKMAEDEAAKLAKESSKGSRGGGGGGGGQKRKVKELSGAVDDADDGGLKKKHKRKLCNPSQGADSLPDQDNDFGNNNNEDDFGNGDNVFNFGNDDNEDWEIDLLRSPNSSGGVMKSGQPAAKFGGQSTENSAPKSKSASSGAVRKPRQPQQRRKMSSSADAASAEKSGAPKRKPQQRKPKQVTKIDDDDDDDDKQSSSSGSSSSSGDEDRPQRPARARKAVSYKEVSVLDCDEDDNDNEAEASDAVSATSGSEQNDDDDSFNA